MKKTVIASAIFAAAIVAAPAAAQENNFSGFTATALAGLDIVRLDDNVDSESESGFAYGGALGYDYRTGRAVIGAEAEIMGATTEYSETTGGGTAKLETGRDLYAGVRVGAVVTSNVLVYGKIGYTNARLKASVTTGGTTVSDSSNEEGYRLGLGTEVAFNKIFGRLEYRYSDYGRAAGSTVDLNRHQVLVGIGYRF